MLNFLYISKLSFLFYYILIRMVFAKSFQSCSTLCDPIDSSPLAPPSLGFSRQEHWSGLPFPSPMHESEKWKWSCSSRARPSVTPWTEADQAPPSTGFSRQEYWSGVPLPYSGSWWWTQKPGVLQSMGLQRVGHDWATEQQTGHFRVDL